MDFQDIKKNLPNSDNMGGLSQKIWIGKYDDVDTWPTEPSSPADAAANGVLTGNLTMKSGTRMFEFYVTDDKGSYNYELVGEMDGKSFKNTLKVSHPGLQAKILGFLNAIKNDNVVIIAIDADGDRWLLGDENRPCTIATGTGGTGDSTEGYKGNNLEFVYKAKKLLRYEGTIDNDSGSGSGI